MVSVCHNLLIQYYVECCALCIQTLSDLCSSYFAVNLHTSGILTIRTYGEMYVYILHKGLQSESKPAMVPHRLQPVLTPSNFFPLPSVFLPFHSRKQNCWATWLILLFQFYTLFKISKVWNCTTWSCIIRGVSVFNKPVVSGVSCGSVNCWLVIQRRCVMSQTNVIIKYTTTKNWELT